MSDPRELELARRELQRLGYLSHRVERFLLRDALEPVGDPRALALLALKVGLLAGSLLALGNTLALALANGVLGTAPFDLLPLFLHLVPPLVAAAALGFVAVVGGFLFALKLFPRRSLEWLILGVTFLAIALLFGWGVLRASDLLLGLARWQRMSVAVALPLIAAAVAKLVANGLLSTAIRLARMTPRERLVSRRSILGVTLATLALVSAVAVVLPQPQPAPLPVALPQSAGERVVLIGVDGILAGEFDYLLAQGSLPAVSRLVSGGAVVASYRHPETREPAEFWTSVATGVGGDRHGVRALDSFRPLGMTTALSRNGPWRTWWMEVEVPLGLAEHRPLLAGRRAAFTFWELSARGGAPSVAIDWWATFPPEPLSGLVVSHGAYQLLLEGHLDAVAPADRAGSLQALAREAEPGPSGRVVAAALPPASVQAVLERAILPDHFYREIARREAQGSPRAMALYLPAIDLLAEGWSGGDVALADLVRSELAETDRLLDVLASGAGTLILVLDPGRRDGAEGRVLIAHPAPASELRCATPGRLEIEPQAVAAVLLRALGLPQSAELPLPPASCSWPEAPANIPGFGERTPRPDLPGDSRDYLENLRSLGYL
ncbi:MAG: hypothetical protein ABI639_02695 [Thermoanaerobaculia bacterium]